MTKRSALRAGIAAGLFAATGCVATDELGGDQEAIVGGTATTIAEHPWQVALATYAEFQFCGGSLLGPSWVLTAQHCVTGGDADIQILAGATRLSQSASGQIRAIDGIARFPGYRSPAYGADVALLHVATPFTLGSTVGPISLITAADAAGGATDAGVIATVTGWGSLSSGGAGSDTLQTVDVPIVSNAAAQAAYIQETITDEMLAAGDMVNGGEDTCQGDSGGPLSVVHGGGRRLAGVTSWGYGCGDVQYPGLYARVSTFAGWIGDRAYGSFNKAYDLSASGAAGSFTHRAITVPPGARTLTVWMRGGTGDADLYLNPGSPPTTSTFTCRPYTATSDEFCTVDSPAPGTWYASIQGYSAYDGVAFTAAHIGVATAPPEVCTGGVDEDGDGATDCADSDCAADPACAPAAEVCTGGADDDGDGAIDCADTDCWANAACTITFTASNQSVAKNAFKQYAAFPVRPGTQFVAFMDRLAKDPDLYVRWSAQPTTTAWNCRPRGAGDETCTLTVPAGVSQAYVAVRGVQSGSNTYHLSVTYNR